MRLVVVCGLCWWYFTLVCMLQPIGSCYEIHCNIIILMVFGFCIITSVDVCILYCLILTFCFWWVGMWCC